MIPLRPYQTKLFNEIHEAWGGGARNVCAVSATGSGKSLLAAHVVAAHRGASCVIAHRQELVGQLAMALARCGVEHSIVAPPATVRNIVQMELREVGRSFYNPLAPCRVAGVNTLVRVDPSTAWLKQTTLWVMDELHHLTIGSTWHRAIEMMPNAKGLGVTATPLRSDGKGLGRHTDGLIDALVCGPPMRSLIDAGYLTDYDIYCPPMTVDLSQVGISASGDYSPGPLSQAMRKSSITGDVVGHYLKVASGKLGVTFAVDIEAAAETTDAYRSRGVPAELVTGKTPDLLRSQILRRLRNREVLQLVSVDIFGEGFDLPAIEVVSFARPTLSYGLYVQQFGRGLRPLPGKTCLVEGTPILTQRGLVAIEEILLTDNVWDGAEWVPHGGTVYMGEKDVISYQGLEATPDHLVHTTQGWTTFRECAEQQIAITATGSGRQEIRIGGDCAGRGRMARQPLPSDVRTRQMSDVPSRGGSAVHEPHGGPNERLPSVQSAETVSDVAICSGSVPVAPVQRPAGFELGFIWRARDPLQFRNENGRVPLDQGQHRGTCPQPNDAAGPDRQRRALRARQPAVVYPEAEHVTYEETPCRGRGPLVPHSVPRHPLRRCNIEEIDREGSDVRSNLRSIPQPPLSQAKRRVWDILDAGPRNCFTAQNLLVHNCATIIDHVGNVLRHGLPDRPRVWSLDRREKRAAAPSDAIPLRACPQCTKVYERTEVQCPYCGHAPVPAGRSRPEEVDGDLHMLTPEVLAAMRTVVAKVDGAPAIPYGAAPEVVGAVRKRHAARQEAQAALRHAMAVWGGASDRVGRERQAQKEFYLRFGVDVLGAQALGAREAAELGERVQSDR